MTTVQTTEQINNAALAKHRRTLPPDGVDRILRNGEVHRRFSQYATKGRGRIEPKMPEDLALETAIHDTFGDPQTSGSRPFAYICTPANIRRVKKYAAGEGAAAKQLVLGDEAAVRAALRATKDRGQIAAMLAAEYQGRNVVVEPRDAVLKLIMARLKSVDESAEAKADRKPASAAELAAALED